MGAIDRAKIESEFEKTTAFDAATNGISIDFALHIAAIARNDALEEAINACDEVNATTDVVE